MSNEKLSDNERLKKESLLLRGSIKNDLNDGMTVTCPLYQIQPSVSNVG